MRVSAISPEPVLLRFRPLFYNSWPRLLDKLPGAVSRVVLCREQALLTTAMAPISTNLVKH